MPRKPLAGKAWWRIGHWGVRFLPMVAELASVVALERLASGARRPEAGGVRMEARRAKTRRAFGRGLVHDSRPPKGARPCEEVSYNDFAAAFFLLLPMMKSAMVM